MRCPPPYKIQKYAEAETRDLASKSLADLVDNDARLRCKPPPDCVPLLTVVDYGESIYFNGEATLWRMWVVMQVVCVKGSWWRSIPRILTDAVLKAMLIVLGVGLTIMGMFSSVGIAAALLKNPEKAGQVIRFTKVLAKKAA